MAKRETLERERDKLIAERDVMPASMLDEHGEVDPHREDQRAARYHEISDRIVELDQQLSGDDD